MPKRRHYTNETVINIGRDFQQDGEQSARAFLVKLLLDIRANLVKLTPVDKGYLRLSIGITVNGVQTYAPPTLDKNVPKGHYSSMWAESEAAYMSAVLEFSLGDVLQIGYTADYAPYVEANQHMVKQTLNMVPSLLRDASAWAKRNRV